MTNREAIWKDVVAVAKFTVSCLGLVGVGFTVYCNLFPTDNKTINDLADANKLKGKRPSSSK